MPTPAGFLMRDADPSHHRRAGIVSVGAMRHPCASVPSASSGAARRRAARFGRISILRPQRYGPGARFYDVLSFERPVYRCGRVRGIELLDLKPGDRVLEVGCGTGLNFPLVHDAVGPGGRIVCVDASPAMLARAQRRVDEHGWSNVELQHGDAAELSLDLSAETDPFDAALFTYSLSIIGSWQRAYARAVECLRPGGRVVVVDLALPVGRWRVLSPLARLACFTGGVDVGRAPWQAVLDSTSDVTHEVLRGGHIHVTAGTAATGRARLGDQHGQQRAMRR